MSANVLRCQRYEHAEAEEAVFRREHGVAAVLLGDVADAAHADAVVLPVCLGGDGQPLFKADGAGAVVFHPDAQKPVFGADIQKHDALLRVLFLRAAFDGVIQGVT